MIDETNYLDIWNIYAYELIGDTTLATIIIVLLITFFALKYKVPWEGTVLLVMLGLLLAFVKTNNMLIYAYIALYVGFIFYTKWHGVWTNR